MFADRKELHIASGAGGDGAILFRREIYVPRGGPDGGDGGRGGDVFVEARTNLHALTHLMRISEIHAEPGAKGGHQRSTGHSGESVTVLVPPGTVIAQSGGTVLAEVLHEGERVKLATGGNGGWGNWRFRSSVNQTPERANPGQPSIELDIVLTLKLIADIGLVGLPNAGKSTLLSVVSAARPKIADYPFTTLEPQLGVAVINDQQVVIADLPGLIEGAANGKGLGNTFLRHIERTHRIIHCLDASSGVESCVENYHIVRHELEGWSTVLADKPEAVALTKIDLVAESDRKELIEQVSTLLGKPVHAVSAAAHIGLDELLTAS